ncbi:MAG TPA: hypothetical protein VHI72_15470, partial [Hyphomicrobiaceae bacterium]|nr:hypothetical protein [Hyphomicrobiaceae bacterium]
ALAAGSVATTASMSAPAVARTTERPEIPLQSMDLRSDRDVITQFLRRHATLMRRKCGKS